PDFTSASRLPWLNATNAATLSVFFFSIPGFVAGFVVSIAAGAGADPTLIVVTVSAAAVVALLMASAVTAITSTAASAAAVTLSAMVSTGSATGIGVTSVLTAVTVSLPASAVTAITSALASATVLTPSAMASAGSATGFGSAPAGFIAALGFWLIIVSPVRSVRRHRRHPGLAIRFRRACCGAARRAIRGHPCGIKLQLYTAQNRRWRDVGRIKRRAVGSRHHSGCWRPVDAVLPRQSRL